MPPAWILDVFAAAMLAVAVLSAARLAVAPRRAAPLAGTDLAHLLMAIAMAGMLVSSLTTLPDGAWEVVFGLLTAWFAYQVGRDARRSGAGASGTRVSGTRALAGGHCVPHLAHSAAMLYMFLALTAPAASGGSGMGASATQILKLPTLAFFFALVLVGYSVWDLDQLSGRRYSLVSANASLAGAAPAGVAVLAAPARSGNANGKPEVRGVLLSPGMTVAGRIVMGVTMALMLLIMI